MALSFLGGFWASESYYTDTLSPDELALARILADRYQADHPEGCPAIGPGSRLCDPDPTPVRSAKSTADRVQLLVAGAVIAGLLVTFGTTSDRARSRKRERRLGAVAGPVGTTDNRVRSRNRGGCFGAAIGSVIFFFLCFGIIPSGEGQLGCLAFPLIGAVMGSFAGAFIGWAVGQPGPPSVGPDQDEPPRHGPSDPA